MFRLKNIRLEVKLHLYLKTSAAWQIMVNSNVKTKPLCFPQKTADKINSSSFSFDLTK